MTPVKPKGEKDKINRRTFFSKSVGLSTGLALLAFPGIIAEVLAQKGTKSKEELSKELDEKVVKFMMSHKSCAQASFCALNEQFKLNADHTIRALFPFTGGLALKGETCGAVSGALLALGFVFEPENQREKEKAGSSIKFGGMFLDRFKKEFGSTRCKGVQEHQYGRSYDFLDPKEKELFMEAAKNGKCMEVVKKAVSIASEIILENA